MKMPDCRQALIAAFALFMLVGTGCQSMGGSSGDLVTYGAALAAGAATYDATDDRSYEEQMALTAGATLGTLALGKAIQANVQRKLAEQYSLGYKMGAADSAKRQYEIIQNRQKQDSQPNARVSVYEFPGLTERDGVKFVPHKVKLRVEE